MRVLRHELPDLLLLNVRRRHLILLGHPRAVRMGRLLLAHRQLIDPKLVVRLPRVADAARDPVSVGNGVLSLCLRRVLVFDFSQVVGFKTFLDMMIFTVNNFVGSILRLIDG